MLCGQNNPVACALKKWDRIRILIVFTSSREITEHLFINFVKNFFCLTVIIKLEHFCVNGLWQIKLGFAAYEKFEILVIAKI